MKFSELIDEVYSHSQKIPDNKIDIIGTINWLLTSYKKINKVSDNVELCVSNQDNNLYYFLLVDNKDVVAWAKISLKTILNTTYDHLDFVYVIPSHRGSNAIKLLLYGLKEESPNQLIADGVLFLDGQRIMSKFLTDTSIFNVQVLNKVTGKVEPFSKLVNDNDKCYLLKETNLGYGKQFMPESFMKFCWYFSLWD